MTGKNSITTFLPYLPSVSWFAKVFSFNEIQFATGEKFVKSTDRNRCLIAGANGIIRLSIPLEKGRQQNIPMKDVRLSHTQHWEKIHWQSILSAYGKAPFFLYYADEFEKIFRQKTSLLTEWNFNLLQYCLQCLQLKITLVLSQELNIAETEKEFPVKSFPRYSQVFEDRYGFISNLSIIDLIFNLGPDANSYLNHLQNSSN